MVRLPIAHSRRIASSAPWAGRALALLFFSLLASSVACTTGRATPDAAPSMPPDGGDTSANAAEPIEGASDEGGGGEPAPSTSEPVDPRGGVTLEPPGGEWLIDEEGKAYFPLELEKIEGYYVKKEGGEIMLPPGLRFDLLEETEDSFVVKVYRVEARPRPEPKLEKGEEGETAASYRPEMGETDRITFERRVLASSGQWRQGFDFGDMNGDGFVDIVHAPPRKSSGMPRVFLGDGEGGWTPWRITVESRGLDYGDVAVADFDGDGNQDIALAVHLRGVTLLLGDGEGGFREAGEGLEYEVPGPGTTIPDFSSRSIAALDWNGDGLPDLLTLGEGPRLARWGRTQRAEPEFSRGAQGPVLFLNQGGERFLRYDQGTGRELVFGDDLAIGDLDGDGALDFVTSSNIDRYAPILHWARVEDEGWEVETLEDARPGILTGVEIADFEGNGRPDLAIAYTASEGGERFTGVDLFLNRGDRTWERVEAVALDEGSDAIRSLAVADLDGDGRPDLLATSERGRRHVWLQSRDGEGLRFDREASPEIQIPEVGCRGYSLKALTTEDGQVRIVAGFAGEPGSEQIFGRGMEKRCLSNGSFEVWDVVVESR